MLKISPTIDCRPPLKASQTFLLNILMGDKNAKVEFDNTGYEEVLIISH
jgi:hypothetical protein